MNMAAQKSKYRPLNEDKYKGTGEIVCRSSWERAICKYFDGSTSIKYWSSEPFSIQYLKPTTKRYHRYFPDFFIELQNGKRILIEVKPAFETKEPVKKKRQKTKTYARQKLTYAVNCAKWNAAQKWCKRNNVEFQIWTEEHIKHLGLKIIS